MFLVSFDLKSEALGRKLSVSATSAVLPLEPLPLIPLTARWSPLYAFPSECRRRTAKTGAMNLLLDVGLLRRALVTLIHLNVSPYVEEVTFWHAGPRARAAHPSLGRLSSTIKMSWHSFPVNIMPIPVLRCPAIVPPAKSSWLTLQNKYQTRLVPGLIFEPF